jgi:hypothetical protein
MKEMRSRPMGRDLGSLGSELRLDANPFLGRSPPPQGGKSIDLPKYMSTQG